jgi:hypothetical protein
MLYLILIRKQQSLQRNLQRLLLSLLIVMVAFLGFNSVTGAEFNNLPSVTNFTQEAPAKTEVAPEESVAPSD